MKLVKLNPDCIRDILICVESLKFGETIEFLDIINALEEYDTDEVLYHIQQCEYNNFFTKTNHFAQSLNGRIYDLTPKAHEFLANIRSDNLWRKTKSAASKIGSVALPVLQQIASNVVEGAVKSYFGLS